MRKQIAAITIILGLVASFTQSCSDKSTEPDNQAEGAKTGSVLIDPAGGSLTATTANGVRVKLTFPPGAVRVPTQITISPQENREGTWMTVALEPAGMVFFQPFDIVVTAPDEISLADGMLQLGEAANPIMLPTDSDPSARTLSTQLTFFGFNDDGTMTVPASPPAQGLRAGNGNNLSAGPVDCAQLLGNTQAVFDQMVANEDFEDAVELALETASLLNEAVCPGVQNWADAAKQAACAALQDAMDDGRSTPTTHFGDFYTQIERVMKWQGVVARLDPLCPAFSDFEPFVVDESNDFVAFFLPRLAAVTSASYSDYLDLKAEAALVFQLITQAYLLGSANAGDLLYEEAFGPVVDKIRETAYSLCQNDNWHLPLSRVTSTGFFAARDMVGIPPPRPGTISPAPTTYATNFDDEDIFKDMQLCATCIDVKTIVASGGTLATGHMQGTSPGVATDAITLAAPTRGKIEVSGMLAAFDCFDGSDGDDEVVFELNGTDVLTILRPLAGSNYLDTPAEIDLLTAAQESGFSPSEGFTTDLIMKRSRSNCDDRLWGDRSYDMLKTTLEWKNPTLEVEVGLPDTLQARSSEELSVRVKVIDQLDQAGFFDAIDVALNVIGGAVDVVNGQTDSEGYFRANVTPDNPTSAVYGVASSGMTVTATATSFEGVSAQQSASATVLPCDAVGHRFRDGGSGQKTLEYGYLSASASADAGDYVYATTEWIDDYAIYPNNTSLNGQNGYMYVKVRYKFTSTGYSDSRPAARVVIGPRNGFSSPYFYERNYNTPGGTDENVSEGEWEIRLSCRFGGSSAPLDVNCDAFARGTDAGTSVSCEVQWLGITRVTTQDGTDVPTYRMCSGSGTDYRVAQ